jgi:hypothetical protein
MARAARPRVAPLVVSLAALGAAGVAGAASPRASSLHWVRLEGAEGCPGARELAEAVERLLGRPIFVPPTQAEAVIEGRAERRLAGGYRAIVSMTRPDGSVVGIRELETPSASCAELEEPLALSIAVMIDPDAGAPRPPSPPPASPPPRGGPWRWGVQAGPTIGLGQVPGAGVGAQIVAQIEAPRFWPIEVRAALGVGSRDAEGPAGALRLRLASAGVALCPLRHAPTPSLALYGCLGPRFGASHAEGRELDEPRRRERPYGEVAAGVRALARAGGPFVGSLGLGLGVPLWRDRYTSAGQDGARSTLFQTSAVVLGADLGLGFFFQ